MGRSLRLLAIGAAVAVCASGCALQDTRYDSRRVTSFGPDYDESILDWNFPTATNLGPLLPPERLRPFPAAIGVPWANGDPLIPRSNLLPIADAAPAPETSGHDEGRACSLDCAAPSPQVGDSTVAGVHQPGGSR
jgi:hypothetical protein